MGDLDFFADVVVVAVLAVAGDQFVMALILNGKGVND